MVDPRKALTSGIIITIIIYIGFALYARRANAFDLALINNHYCTKRERARRPARVPYAGVVPGKGRSPAVPEGEKIESTT